MAEFQEVMNQKVRMCETQESCKRCNLNSFNNGKNIGCVGFISAYPQEAEDIIMKWAKEHPVKTNADKFEEVFGFRPNVREYQTCFGDHCPHDGRDYKDCNDCEHHGFWDREYKEVTDDIQS